MKVIFCVMMMVLCAGEMYGRAARKSDYVSVGVGAGYGTLLGKTAGMTVTGGATGGVNVGYEYREGSFWANGGLDLQYFGTGCRSDMSVGNVWFTDTRMTKAMMIYTMNSARMEMMNWGFARIAFLAGYCTANHNKNGFYVGGGLKLGGKFDIRNTTRLRYTTSAVYERYIDPYEDMPNHYYTVNDVEDTVSLGTRFSIDVIAEMGWDLKITKCDRMKVGFFVEAGLNNIMDGVTTREPWVDENNVSIVKPYSVYNSEAMSKKYVVPVTGGVKVTFLFNVSRIKSRCRSCPCYRKR